MSARKTDKPLRNARNRTARPSGNRDVPLEGHRRRAARAIACWAALALAALFAPGCRKAEPGTPPEAPRVETIARGDVQVAVEAAPPRVRFDRDMVLTFTVTAPSEIDVTLPPLDDRLQGFIAQESYAEDPVVQGGRRTQVVRMRLTPTLADEYRLAPIAVRTRDTGRTPPREGWFPTQPIVFEAVPPRADAPGRLQDDVRPAWIYPPFRTVALWVLAGLAGLGLLLLLWKLLRRVHREVQLRRLSPRERAMRELDTLMAKHLIESKRFKEFYLELTMIVRRYIERQHAIRAPEQTTEEFLEAAGHNPRFTPDTLRRLRDFLQAADLVKFAAHRPAPDAVQAATDTARDYIAHDAAADATDPGDESDAGTGDA